MVVDAGGQRTPNGIMDPAAPVSADRPTCVLEPDAAAVLDAAMAELDSRLVRVISMAIAEQPCCLEHAAANAARAVWAWLAQGDD